MTHFTTMREDLPHTQMVLADSRLVTHGTSVAVEIYSGSEIEALRRAGRVAAATLRAVATRVKAGVSTGAIDAWVRQDTKMRGALPSQLGYKGFPAAVCVSRNDVVCHGIPSPHELIEEGDIVNVDVTSEFCGFHGDTSMMILVGQVTPEAAHVVEVARQCRDAGVAAVKPGARLGDIAHTIMEVARAGGCSVVRELGGHGIGRSMHQEPHVSYVGKKGRGLRLQPGMTLTIEPMINLGGPGVVFLDDGWTVKTKDGSLSAQFEHTVLVTADGGEILTETSPDDAWATNSPPTVEHVFESASRRF